MSYAQELLNGFAEGRGGAVLKSAPQGTRSLIPAQSNRNSDVGALGFGSRVTEKNPPKPLQSPYARNKVPEGTPDLRRKLSKTLQ